MDARVDFPQTALSAARPAAAWSRRSGDRVTALFGLALVLPLIASIIDSRGAIVLLAAGSVAVSLGWTMLFARLRSRTLNVHAVVTAIIFALLVPPEVPLWQALLSLSFGVVVGEQIFGGRGYSFLHPAVAALAFLFFSFPASTTAQASSLLVMLSALPGAVLLLATGLISWRVLVGVGVGLAFWLALKGAVPPFEALFTSSLLLGAVFLISEPVSAAATNPGRWAYGVLAGVLLVLIGAAGSGMGAPDTVVFSALLASIFAPLIDRVVVHFNVRRRRRRQWPT